MSLWAELKRRNVFRVAVAYLVASWLIVQVAGQLTGPLNLPQSFATVVIVLLVIGLPVALVIAWIYEVTPEGLRATADIDASGLARHQSTRRLNYVIVALLVAAVGLMAVDTFVQRDMGLAPESVATAEETTTVQPEPGVDQAIDAGDASADAITLAVLPFDDGSQAGDQGYLADGIAGEIRSTLSLVEGLNVIGEMTSPRLKEQYADTRSMREEWGIEFVLTGNVRRVDDQLRIRVTLTDTDTGTITFTDNYERTFDDSFPMLDQIAEAVAQAMEITLGVGEVGGRLGMTRNARAFEEYLKGIVPPLSVDVARESVAHLERAVALDDSFALAWFGLYRQSRTLVTLQRAQGGDPVALARADEAMRRVLELTPELPELLLADLNRSASSVDFFDLGQRFAEFSRRATSSGYPFAEIAVMEGLFLYATGQVADAISLLERALASDPLNRSVVIVLTEAYAAQGRPDDARRIAEQYVAKNGFLFEVFARAPYAALETGDPEVISRVLALWDRYEGASGLNGFINRMGQLIDEPERALEEIETFVQSTGAQTFGAELHTAPWAAYFGDTDLALEIMRRGGLQSTVMNIPRPLFADVRRTEGFKELVRDVGLVEYWRETGNWADYCRPLGLDDFECF